MLYQKKLQDSVEKPSDSVEPSYKDYTLTDIDWGRTRDVILKCVWCVKGKCQRENRCIELWDREDYLCETRYFQKYSSESVWGKWRQDQLGVEVVYS